MTKEWRARPATQEHGRQERDPDERDVEPGIVGDPGADAHDLAVLLVAIEASPACRLAARISRLLDRVGRALTHALRLVGAHFARRVAVVGHVTHRPRAYGACHR